MICLQPPKMFGKKYPSDYTGDGPILHLRISSNDQNIDLPKELLAQKLTFIRANIYKDTTNGADYQGSVFVDLDFFNGFEVNSNLSDNFLIVPIKKAEEIQTYQFEQEFNAEAVKQSFNCKVFYYDPTSGSFIKAPFKEGTSVAGRIIHMDLFFQVASLWDYTSY